MPTLDTSPMSLDALSAMARGPLEIIDVEAGLVRVDGAEHFVLFFKCKTADGQGATTVTLQTSPVGGVLIHQQLRELFSTRGGVLAVLRQALNTPDTTSPVDALRAAGVQMGPTVDVRGMTPEKAAAAVAAAAPAFEGAER